MSFPQPSPEARQQSASLARLMHDAVRAAGGWIPFSRYMELALYAPGLGYYSGGARKFGPAGDFITAPELTPLFGQALAGQLAQVLNHCGGEIVEVGAGTGLLAADLLLALQSLDALPERYAILELSGELRARQQATLAERAPHLAHRAHWLDTLPDTVSGVVLANEVLDAMPVEIVVSRPDGLFERGVAIDDEGLLRWADTPARGAAASFAAKLDLPVPTQGEYVTEINLAARAWVAEWARRLAAGALLLVDYGYSRAQYYQPGRENGTLLCYYRHQAHGDPFLWPGLNDITAFVEFTSIAEAAHDAGLEVLGYTSQAAFLFNCEILTCLARRGPEESIQYINAARAVQRLTSPNEMGELFKVLALGRGLDLPLLGFMRGDRLHTL